MLAEACFVWNHALALQKRYYRLYGGYISLYTLINHQTKRWKRELLSAQVVQEILKKLDVSYKRYFKNISSRPPKYKKAINFSSIDFRYWKDKNYYGIDSCKVNENNVIFNKIEKNINFQTIEDMKER